ncbi:MAG: UDP-N-acetylmuramoyl-tripeptide--D-alanyl-D-alanine ligase [Proteobacteria bacterium]|nr:UDP-N-acetylmuramoyl-tripeptide--D-alanyl-D-alanine ligase [Pseudomonadota bacterium]
MTKHILWTSEEVSQILNAKSKTAWKATGVSIDTRTIEKGDIFVAIKGDRFDGSEFVKEALLKGAVAAISEKKIDGVKKDASVLVVDDALEALVKLAKARRENTKAKLIAVTGSVGKTSVKEAIRAVLEDQGETYANKGNLNNHIGLPLSICRMPKEAKYGVFELGMNHAGELSHLTAILRPHVAVVTTVEAVHLEFFDSVEGIAEAKAEIMEGVDKKGSVVLNRDNAYFPILKKKAASLGIKDVRAFGRHKDAKYRLIDTTITPQGIKVEADIGGEKLKYQLKTFGTHHAQNSVAVLAAISAAGANIEKATKTLGKITAEKGRGRLHHLKLGGKVFTLIDDSYNASPASIRAGLEVLSTLKKISGGRTVAVLGDMRELGDESEKLHKSLIGDVVDNKIDRVYCAGNFMKYLFDGLPKGKQARHATEPLALLGILERQIENNDIVMIKGSNGTGTWKLVDALIADADEAKMK